MSPSFCFEFCTPYWLIFLPTEREPEKDTERQFGLKRSVARQRQMTRKLKATQEERAGAEVKEMGEDRTNGRGQVGETWWP